MSTHIMKNITKWEYLDSVLVIAKMRFCKCSIFCCALLCVHSSFQITSMGKSELVGLLCYFSWCLVIAVWLFLTMPQVCDCGIS